jgi:hypothetical protein
MTDVVLVALIAAVASTLAAGLSAAAVIVSVRGNRKTEALAVSVDGRLTQLLSSVGTEQHALGRADGIEQERNRT